jgi:hypothetical protein
MPSTSTSSVWSAPWLITLLYTVILLRRGFVAQ